MKKSLDTMAKRSMLRGNTTGANLINNFGSLGKGSARQAVNSTLRKKTGEVSAPSISKAESKSPIKKLSQQSQADSRILTKDDIKNKNTLGRNILDAIR